jgi:acyl-CoA synthetase (AMP-forming)/AMP-acid ligase II/thioesterase domain-containing protein/acyl carrier protein
MTTVNAADQPTRVGRGLSIRELVETHAERRPDAVAIMAPDRPSLSYGRLWEHTADVVRTLNSFGLGRGDRVAILLPNGPDLAVAFLAVSSAATCAPLNPAYRAEEFDFYLSDLNARALIIQSGCDSPAIPVARARGIPIFELSPVSEAPAGIFTLKRDQGCGATGANGHTLMPGFAQPDDVALVLHTSGTTSRPKIVPLTQTNVCTTAQNMQVALELTEEDRGLTVMPLFHIHGLIGATLAPLAAGGSMVCTPGFDMTRFFHWMDAFHPTWYTAVPTMHQALLTRAEANRSSIDRCPLRFIRSCSAALPPQVMAEIEKVFRAPVTESYGMTEASHQITGNPLPPRERRPGSVGVSAGPEIATMDETGNLLPPGERGEVVIRGANVTRGYENNPAANKGAFTNGWFRTGDQGHLDADGYLYITGRLKEIINRGGEKISPREVDEVLMDHPSVVQVATFAAPHVSLGEEVAAAVVLRQNASVTESEIQEFARSRLADFKIPRRVIFLKEIPKGPTGKLQRIGLAEKLGLTTPLPARADSHGAFAAPRDALESTLTEIWERVLATKHVGIKDNFFDLGGNSLLAVALIIEIEKSTGRNLPPSFLLQAPTIEQLADVLRKGDETLFSSPVVAIQPRGSNPPFFFIHAVSGNVLNYLPLSRYLGPDQPFYGVQARGLDGKLPPLRRIEEMAAFYIKEICALQPEGPYFLGGGSSGGIVAFEMAQQLCAEGQEVATLALFDTYFPVHKTNTLVHKVDRLLGNLMLRRPKDRVSFLFGMVGAKVGKSVQGLAQRFNPEGEASPARVMRHVLEANREAVSKYVPKPYLGRIVLLLSSEAPERSFYDSRLAWSDIAAGGLEVHVVPGNHDTLFAEPHVKVMAERLRTCLQRAPVYSLVS